MVVTIYKKKREEEEGAIQLVVKTVLQFIPRRAKLPREYIQSSDALRLARKNIREKRTVVVNFISEKWRVFIFAGESTL